MLGILLSGILVGWCSFALTAPAVAQGPAPRPDQLTGFAKSLTDVPARSSLTRRGSVCVPAYSRIRLGGGKGVVDFATTLGIHNTSETHPLIIERVDYFATNGELVEQYLNERIAIRPLGTVEIFVADADTRGGSGANFVVGWSAGGTMSQPLIEAVMIGSLGTNGFTLVSRGQPIASLDKP